MANFVYIAKVDLRDSWLTGALKRQSGQPANITVGNFTTVVVVEALDGDRLVGGCATDSNLVANTEQQLQYVVSLVAPQFNQKVFVLMIYEFQCHMRFSSSPLECSLQFNCAVMSVC